MLTLPDCPENTGIKQKLLQTQTDLSSLFSRLDCKQQEVVALIRLLDELKTLLPGESESELMKFLMEIDLDDNGYIHLHEYNLYFGLSSTSTPTNTP